MQLLAILSVLATSVSAGQVLPPGAKSLACAVPDFVWQHARGPEDCQANPETPAKTLFACGSVGVIELNQGKNIIKIGLASTADFRGLALHGKCMQAGQQVAHFDIYAAAASGAAFDSTFHAFNRNCPIGSQVSVVHYELTPKQLNECAQHPITPVH